MYMALLSNARQLYLHLNWMYFINVFRHEIENHGNHFNNREGERDEYGYYYCQHGCGNVFSTKATRKK